MVTGDLVRPARNRRLLLAFALLLALVVVALVTAHAMLGAAAPGAPAHALSSIHRPIGCGAVPLPC